MCTRVSPYVFRRRRSSPARHLVVNVGETPKSIPVTIIGGFLGAGKTTLLNYILSENHGRRAAVLVNDFGAINIDAKLVVGVEGETINLANGCICCTIRDDLVGACLRLLQRPEQLDYLIVETSGVSNPVLIANTFLLPELQRMLSLDSILCVVDSEQFSKLSGESAALAELQVEAADIVVLNKTDLVDGESLAAIRSSIRAISARSQMLEAHHGRVPLSLILGGVPQAVATVSERVRRAVQCTGRMASFRVGTGRAIGHFLFPSCVRCSSACPRRFIVLRASSIWRNFPSIGSSSRKSAGARISETSENGGRRRREPRS